MAYRTISLDQTPITLSNNQSSSLEFVRELASREGSDSFFVADLGQIYSLVDQWFKGLPRVQPFYALGCNADEMLVRIMASHQRIGFHCTSRRHMELALQAAGPERLFYSNPCWTRSAVNGAQSNGPLLLGFDSEGDLTRMSKSGVTNRLILNVRMSSEVDAVTGCDVASAPKLLQLAADFGLNCVGVSFDVCSQRLGLFDSIIECAVQLFAIGRSMGLCMKVLNLGGSFPSPLSEQPGLTFAQVCDQLNASLNYYIPPDDDIEIIATPGQFFAASVFSLATRIVDRSEVDASEITHDDFDEGQKAFVYKINEGYYGAFGCSIMPQCRPQCQPLFADSANDQSQSQLFHGSIIGPVDERFDVVLPQCRMRQMCAGEWLLWPELGSYSLNNWESLDDDDRCNTPEIYYFSKEHDWKFAENSGGQLDEDGRSDEADEGYTTPLNEPDVPFDVENEQNVEECTVELAAQPLIFDWPIA